ncbi:MAG: DUF971 domain-containing protein [Chlamydiae bacterium]|nr:DUF971 domain-containing protein [Chlamydiota bacterium]
MLSNKNFVKNIYQKNNYIFTIEWIDGKISDYRLSDLQRLCSCARCVDEITGERLVNPSQVPDDLTAVRVYSMGRYALKIDFSSGCSRGVYPYEWLRQWSS